MEIIKKHLPTNCYSKNKMKSIDGAVIHFISARNVLPDDPFNLEAIMNIFKDYKVSANYLIDRDGTIIELVPDMRKSYHAGNSRMNKRNNCNDFTIGIELVGGTNWPYTSNQMSALGELLAHLMTDHQFTLDWVQGHDEIRTAWREKYPDKVKKLEAEGKGYKCAIKVDPGNHFPWLQLNEMLVGVSAAVGDSDGG